MLNPAQEQRWDPIEGFRPALASASAQRELRRWTLIGLGALALAGVYALLLAISRIPGADTLFPWPVAFYEKSLIIHVVFSFVVWYLAIGIILMMIGAYRMSDGAPKLPGLGASALAAMVIAFIMLAVPALMDRGQPSLNNYVPAIIDPIYYIGLLLVAFSIVLATVRSLANCIDRSGPLEPAGAAGLASGIISLAAVAAFAIAWNRLGVMPTTAAENEDLFWAGGHILQFFNTTVMIAGWALLGGRALGRPAIAPRTVMVALGINALLAVGAVILMFVEDPFSGEERILFTHYQYALAPVPIFLGLIIGWTVLRTPNPDADTAKTARLALLLSLVVFYAGGILGIFVDGTDTRTPAHYHGVIGGVNVAAMGLVILFVLPLLERGLARWRAIRASFWLYGLGQLLHSLGLFIAGGYGAPRKVSDTAPGMDVIGNWIGHVGIGIGGVIAVIGGIMFIWIAGKRTLARTG
ncbi:MAG: cbb3-type cytochrome c oxidase subunit I [Rhodospirillales bacterium]|nr:cbb3-type cytochrome c oxidase subunit I [Rhodospirillales bacterium]MBO6785664.1 cbb3-type cytochrome c oxidase subunit I [Rhodospirillales bacterium]